MNWDEVLNYVVKIILVIVLGLISVYVKPWLQAKKSEAEAKAEVDKQAALWDKIFKLCAGAEKMAISTGWTGLEKNNYVVQILESMGITVDKEMSTYIDGIVAEMDDMFYGTINPNATEAEE